MKVVLLDQVHPEFLTTFKQWGWEVTDGHNWTLEELNHRIHHIEGVIIRSRIQLNKEILSKAVKLKFIGRPGSGLENIDIDFCKEKNIQVFRSPEGNRDAVGEHVIGMLLMLMNHLKRADLQVRRGQWNRESNRGIEIKGKTIGIIGYGFMGRSLAVKLSGFDADVIAYDKYKTNFSSSIIKEVSLLELQEKADIVSIHTPLTEETIGMVDLSFLESFKKPILLINTARGQSVVLKDLLIAINKGIVLGACLDVLETESHSFESLGTKQHSVLKELLEKEEVIFSPHIAGWTFEAKKKMATVVIDKIKKVFVE